MLVALLIALEVLQPRTPVGLPPQPVRIPLPVWSALWHPRAKGERPYRHRR